MGRYFVNGKHPKKFDELCTLKVLTDVSRVKEFNLTKDQFRQQLENLVPLFKVNRHAKAFDLLVCRYCILACIESKTIMQLKVNGVLLTEQDAFFHGQLRPLKWW